MAQSYANRQGSGPRLDGVILFKTEDINWLNNPNDLIDGIIGAGNTWWSAATAGSGYFQYDFGEARLITQARWRQQSASTHGEWIWRGSQDGASWTDIGSSFILGGAEVSTHDLSSNATAYRFYRCAFLSGSVSGSPYLFQIEWEIDDGTANALSFGSPYAAGERRYLIDASSTVPIGSSTGVSKLLDGKINSDGGSLWFSDATSGAIKFDFRKPVAIDFGRFFQSGAHAQGDWQWQGSNDDAAWENVGAVFSLAPSGTYGIFCQNLNSLEGNLKEFRYWRMQIVGGTTTSVPTLYQILFRASKETADAAWDDVVLRQTFNDDFADFSNGAHAFTPQYDPWSPDLAAGKFSQALSVDFYGQGIHTAPSPDFHFGSGSFTVEFWVRNSTSAFLSNLLSLWTQTGDQRSWRIYAANGATADLGVGISEDGVGEIFDGWISAASIRAGVWEHICLERSGSTFRLYVNGVMRWKYTSSSALFAAGGRLRIAGATNPASSNNGFVRIDDTRITKGLARYATDNGFAPPLQPFPVSGGEVPSDDVKPGPGSLVFSGYAPSFPTGITVKPEAGSLSFAGVAPELAEDFVSAPAAGELLIRGVAPELSAITPKLDVPAGGLRLAGSAPSLLVGLVVIPPAGRMAFSGYEPVLFIKLSALASQAALLSYSIPPPPPVRSSQSAALLLGEPPPPPTRASQAALIAIGEIVPDVKVSQTAIITLAYAEACISRRADVWIITRKDGRVLAFTGHDEAIMFGTLRATPCGSLSPSAIQQDSELAGIGNMELTGLITSSEISERDLYGGLYDDAFVEVWSVSWDPQLIEPPVRLAAGWCGNLSHGKSGFSMGVVGPGARIQQQALTQTVTPGCRRVFGSPQGQLPPFGCGVNVGFYSRACTVVTPTNRGRIKIDIGAGPDAPQWANGLARWKTGPNAGARCEIKTLDLTTGELILWSPTPFLAEVGDELEIDPGCDKLKATCKLYSNYINFGGFSDLPGTDAITETPDATL